jgi:hypothetical protein
MTMERRSAPIMTLSLACSKSNMVTTRLPARAASSAASFTRLARSAPEKPGVPRAMVRASTSGRQRHLAHMHLEDLLAAVDVRIRAPRSAGRNGRGAAAPGSSTSGRLVAAIRMTPSLASKPSISTSNWLRVCSRSSLPPPRPAPRWRPTASISSMKMMQGRVLLALLEHVAHAAGADADEHLDEVGAGDGEERHVGFARDGARQQRLTGARRADQQAAFRDLAAQALEFLRVFEEVDDLFELGLGFLDAGDVVEGDAALALGQQARARLAEAHGLAAIGLHLAQHEYPERDDQDDRRPLHQQRRTAGSSLPAGRP